jgi:hypothetical protein
MALMEAAAAGGKHCVRKIRLIYYEGVANQWSPLSFPEISLFWYYI